MIDVQINPFGRSLVTMILGAMKMQAMMQAKNVANLKKETDKIISLKKDNALWEDISFDITTKMLDKRFKEPTFKKSLNQADRNLQYITEQQSLKSRTRYNSAVSQYNQRLTEKKVKTAFRLVDIKKVL